MGVPRGVWARFIEIVFKAANFISLLLMGASSYWITADMRPRSGLVFVVIDRIERALRALIML